MAARHDSLDSEEFVRLSLTDSTYAKVIFSDVKDFYLANEDLNCAFTMMSSIKPMVGDKVALYKVGWSCADDYIIAQPCLIENSEFPGELSITFAGSLLPKDDGEYYQFCYITANGEIRGGSTPFVFKISPVEDLISEEDIENDLMLIQTRTSMLEGSLQKAMMERTGMLIEKQTLEKDCESQKAKLILFENIVKDQEGQLKELESKLAENETVTANSEVMLREEISQQNHFINGMKVAVSALGKEKSELEKVISDLHLEKDSLKGNCSALHSQLDDSIFAEKASRNELNSSLETIAFLQMHSSKLERELSEKLSHINTLEKELQDVHLQYNANRTQLADKEMMLAAMAASKCLATEELKKYAKKQAKIEAEKCCLSEQLEKYKTRVDTLENEKLEISMQLKVSLSENAVNKNENKLLLENQTELQEQSSKLNLEVKDLQNRLALGGEEYRRKYIEWHKMQSKVIKLQKKLLSLQSNKKDSQCVANLQHSTNTSNEQRCLPEAQELTVSVSDLQSDLSENQIPLSNTKNVCISANLNQEQSAKIHAAMENQLQKFHGTKSSSTSPTDINVKENGGTNEAQSISSSTSQSPYYPYPYPQNLTTDALSYNSKSISNSSAFSPEPYAEVRWLSSGSNEDSFVVVPSSNTQVLTQKNVQLQPHIQAQPFFQFGPCVRTQEEDCMNSSHCIKCPICEECFPKHSDINEHIDSHIYFKCPVCLHFFPKEEFDMESFNKHVLEHLD